MVSFSKPSAMSAFQCGERLFVAGIEAPRAMRLAALGQGALVSYHSEADAMAMLTMLRMSGITSWVNEVSNGQVAARLEYPEK